MKKLLRETAKELFGIDRQFSTIEIGLFYLVVLTTTALAIYFI